MTVLLLLLTLFAVAEDQDTLLLRRHREAQGIVPPTQGGGGKSGKGAAKLPPDHSEIRPTQTGRENLVHPDSPHRGGPKPVGGAAVALEGACDTKPPLDSLFDMHPALNLSAAGGNLYFLSGETLWRVDPAQGTPAVVAKGVLYFQVSPDGRGLFTLERTEQGTELRMQWQGKAVPSPSLPGGLLSAQWRPDGSGLVLTLAQGAESAIYSWTAGGTPALQGKLNGPAYLSDISPDGSLAALTVHRSGEKADLYLLKGPQRLERWRALSSALEARFAGDSKGLFFTDYADGTKPRLYHAPLANPRRTRLLTPTREFVGRFTVSSSRSLLVVEMDRGGYSELVGMEVDGAGNRRSTLPLGHLAAGDRVVESVGVVGSSVVASTSSPTEAPGVWIEEAGERRLLWSAGESWDRCPLTAQAVKYPSFDGKTVHGFLYPRGRPHDPRPTLLYVEGTPALPFRPRFHPVVRYLWERGYTVLAPNVRGRGGRDLPWLRGDDGPQRPGAAKDLVKGAQWLLQQKYAAPDTLATVGSEYGGWLALKGEEVSPGTLGALVLWRPWTDLRAKVEEAAPLLRPIYEAEYGLPAEPHLRRTVVGTASEAEALGMAFFAPESGRGLASVDSLTAKELSRQTLSWLEDRKSKKKKGP